MADEAMEGAQEKKGGKMKWIIIILLVLLLGGGAAAFFMFKDKILGSDEETPQVESTEDMGQAAEGEGEGEPMNTKMISLPTFLVNLADPLGRRYLKLSMDVELRDEAAAMKLEQNMSKVKDTIILLLSSITYAQLSGFESKVNLKNQIVKRLNQIIGGSSVLRVYITEMVVQ